MLSRAKNWTQGGLTENDGRENDGPSKLQSVKLQDMKLQDMKMQDMKITDQKWRHGVILQEKNSLNRDNIVPTLRRFCRLRSTMIYDMIYDIVQWRV